MSNNNFFNEDDLKDLFSQMGDEVENEVEVEETEEMIASRKRYEEIIKKHKNQ